MLPSVAAAGVMMPCFPAATEPPECQSTCEPQQDRGGLPLLFAPLPLGSGDYGAAWDDPWRGELPPVVDWPDGGDDPASVETVPEPATWVVFAAVGVVMAWRGLRSNHTEN